ncbi:hypothetical protein [Bradyrhizobium genomosp. III]|uniref:hypothetical protein n=1 Tax=Bradyrhizobium genomosp. III TaxID=2683271 RepID=UPI0012F4E97E|nr:hypothetical protein [Bradyrhizobium sp. CCBAU 15635]
MRQLTEAEIAILQRTEQLPDSAAVPLKICALMSGVSERTWRRNPPVPTFHLSAGKKGANLGAVRQRCRGEAASSAA